jgi:hypothetical protein
MLPMKRFFIVCLLLQAFNSNAQSLELGLGGGFSINGAPSGGNMVYTTDESVVNYSGTMKLLYMNRSGWQFGLDGHVVELSGKSSKQYVSFYSQDSVGGDGKKFVYAKYAVSVAAVVNKMLPVGKDKFYVGLAIGYAGTRNNTQERRSNESYKAPDGGKGMVLGGQLGYIATLSEKIALNVDVAIRHYNLKYDEATAPLVVPTESLNYKILSVPVTFGIRYYFFKVNHDEVPRDYRVRPRGRSLY